MRLPIVLFILANLLVHVLGRPAQVEDENESDLEENVYEDENTAADEDSPNAEEQQTNIRISKTNTEDVAEAPPNRRVLDFSGNTYLQRLAEARSPRAKPFENVPEMKNGGYNEIAEESIDESVNPSDYETMSKRRNHDKYMENSDSNEQTESAEHLTNHDVNNKPGHCQNNDNRDEQLSEETLTNDDVAGSDDTNRLLQNNYHDQVQRNSDESETADASEQNHYNNKAFDNTFGSESKGLKAGRHFKRHMHKRNRGRRQAQDIVHEPEMSTDSALKKEPNADLLENEDEEAAIKRHIKKLSSDELQDLLSSLSEDKKELLKTIIDSDRTDLESINKREITKKAGAVEENNYVENGQPDVGKLQSVSPVDDVNINDMLTEATTSQSGDTTEGIKLPESPTDNGDSTTTKSTDMTSGSVEMKKSDLSNSIEVSTQEKLHDQCSNNKNQVNASPNTMTAAVVKSENKREANFEDSKTDDFSDKLSEIDADLKEIQDSADDESFLGPQDDDLSQLIDSDESQLQDSRGTSYKRETSPEDKHREMSDSIKSLEESFPNSNSYDEGDSYQGSNMAPLVRVKRKNRLIPDSKVAYLPYKAENDDEDNDEGSEFDDDGFYDRTLNLAQSDPNIDEAIALKRDNYGNDLKRNRNKLSRPNKSFDKTDNNLGSDTDSDMSGVEGVDDNLMFSSSIRSRRSSKGKKTEAPKYRKLKENAEYNGEARISPSSEDESSPESESNLNVPNYQENDSFGPLPRTYEGELGRYKRIRRVKNVPGSESLSEST